MKGHELLLLAVYPGKNSTGKDGFDLKFIIIVDSLHLGRLLNVECPIALTEKLKHSAVWIALVNKAHNVKHHIVDVLLCKEEEQLISALD